MEFIKLQNIKRTRTYGFNIFTIYNLFHECKRLGLKINQGFKVDRNPSETDAEVDGVIQWTKEN